MADKISNEVRSRNMAAIKSVSKLEDRISKVLWSQGLRYRRNVKDLFGKPDFSIKKYKVVIFIDSCFWHRCPIHGSMPKTNADFWKEKLNRNVERDREVTDYYIKKGWHILRMWEHELKEDFDASTEKIVAFIRKTRGNSNKL